jgi:hypothetical protein
MVLLYLCLRTSVVRAVTTNTTFPIHFIHKPLTRLYLSLTLSNHQVVTWNTQTYATRLANLVTLAFLLTHAHPTADDTSYGNDLSSVGVCATRTDCAVYASDVLNSIRDVRRLTGVDVPFATVNRFRDYMTCAYRSHDVDSEIGLRARQVTVDNCPLIKQL